MSFPAKKLHIKTEEVSGCWGLGVATLGLASCPLVPSARRSSRRASTAPELWLRRPKKVSPGNARKASEQRKRRLERMARVMGGA